MLQVFRDILALFFTLTLLASGLTGIVAFLTGGRDLAAVAVVGVLVSVVALSVIPPNGRPS